MKLFWLSILTVVCGELAMGQACPAGTVSATQFVAGISATNDPLYIYRAGAIAGSAALGQLRRVTQPNLPFTSVPGAAQVALAKLGDQSALRELKAELNGSKNNRQAVEKLVRTQNDAALSVLMDYLIEHLHDKSRVINHGDYSYDPLELLTRELLQILPNPPAVSADLTFDRQLEAWKEWWLKNRTGNVFVVIEKEFSDPYLRCLARKVDWGFPDAALVMSLHDEKSVVALRRLLGSSKIAPFHSLFGNVQTVLARAGDRDELNKITEELYKESVDDAITKLRFIGGREAVRILVHALDSSRYRSTIRTYYAAKDVEALVTSYEKAVLYALARLVKNPPLPPDAPPGRDSLVTWTAWWNKMQGTAAFNDFRPDYTQE